MLDISKLSSAAWYAGPPTRRAREGQWTFEFSLCYWTALYDDEVGVLLIDEPELSLTPSIFSHFFFVKSRCGRPIQWIVARKLCYWRTHRPRFIHVVRPEDLTNMVFFIDVVTPPLQVSPGCVRIEKPQAEEHLLLNLGEAHKEAFFSSRVFTSGRPQRRDNV